MAKIITLSLSKGGTTKTSSTLNIGAALYQMDYKVLVADLDQQCSLTTDLGVELRPGQPTTYELLALPATKAKDVITETPEGFDLLPASISLATAAYAIQQDFGRERILGRKLESIKTDYDYILIDTPPSFEITTINGMAAADYVLMPFLPEKATIPALNQVEARLEAMRDNLNVNVELLGIFITLYDNIKAHKEYSRIVREDWGDVVFDTIIRRRSSHHRAAAETRSVVSMEPTSDLAQDYINLTKEVVARAK